MINALYKVPRNYAAADGRSHIHTHTHTHIIKTDGGGAVQALDRSMSLWIAVAPIRTIKVVQWEHSRSIFVPVAVQPAIPPCRKNLLPDESLSSLHQSLTHRVTHWMREFQ